MLENSSLIGLIGSKEQVLELYNSSEKKSICELDFSSNIKRFKFTTKNIIISLTDKIFIFAIENIKLLKTIETEENKEGIIEASKDYLVYPYKNVGELIVVDLNNNSPITVFQVPK
jgi:hypothetical protein